MFATLSGGQGLLQRGELRGADGALVRGGARSVLGSAPRVSVQFTPNWPRRSAAYSPARCGESHRCRRICPSIPRNTRRDHEGTDPHDGDDDETNRTSPAAGGGSQTMQTHQMQKEPQADPECKLSRQMFHLGVSAPDHAG